MTPEQEYLHRRGRMIRNATRHGLNTGYLSPGHEPVTTSETDGSQARRLQNITAEGYVRTPTGAKRIKQPVIRPSLQATLNDTRLGGRGHHIPAGVAKADNDPGASLSRAERRARVAGAAALPIPVAGDAIMAGTAARMSPEPYRRRTAGQMYGASAGGQYTGYALGGLGAAALADRSPKIKRGFDAADSTIKQAKTAAYSRTPKKFQTKVSQAQEKMSARPSGKIGQGFGRAKSAAKATRAGKLVSRNPAAAAVGMLAGGAAGGQVGQQSMYNHVMNRDDKYRAGQMAKAMYGLRSDIAKREMSTHDRHELAERKRRAATLSTVSGLAGMGALGASMGTAGIKNAGKMRNMARAARSGEQVFAKPKKPKSATEALDAVKTPLLGVSAGVGGYSGLNFAEMNRQEAENLDPERNRLRRQRYRERRELASKAFGAPVVGSTPSKPMTTPPAKGTPGPRKPKSTTRRSHLRRTVAPSGQIRTQSIQGSQR